MFDAQSGRNRHRKPVMYDDLATDTEWGMLSHRPLGRWSKRRPTKRALALLACLFVAAVYGVRVLNTPRHDVLNPEVDAEPTAGVDTEVPLHHNESEQSGEAEEGQGSEEPPNWDNLPKPPLFDRYHEAEMALPQHHVADPFAGGKKYLWVENHVHGEFLLPFFIG